MPYDELRSNASIDDAVIFKGDHDSLIGKIFEIDSNNSITVILFLQMSAELLIRHSLPSITNSESPVATKSGMVEVFLSGTRLVIDRASIIDIAFIVPLHEVEGGLFHLAGARNTYFIRYQQHHDRGFEVYSGSMLQPRSVEPFSFRIFRSLNMLSTSIKKLFYHQPEEQSVFKTFRVTFSFEGFYYISSKFRGKNHVIMHPIQRKQRCISYYDDLSMKNMCRMNQVHVIRVLTSGALGYLRELLGIGVGVGLGKPRPTKGAPEAYCCINDTITSLELPDRIPMEHIMNPMHRLHCNGVDFIYTIENFSLQCNIRYTKILVATEAIAVDRISTAVIRRQELVPYVGAMFFYGDSNALCSIEVINRGTATCIYMEDDFPPFNISLQDATALLATFGRRR